MDAEAFAADWEAAWNAHDLDRIMAHYVTDIVFRSAKAVALTGNGLVQGKAALRAYWQKALERQPDLKFTVETVYAGHDVIVIAYRNQTGARAAETLRFAPSGLVIEASACHAA